MSNWRNDPITQKQMDLIMEMQETAGMNGAIELPAFKGKTKGEACDWISKNMGKQYQTFDFGSHGDNFGDRI